MTIHKSNNKCFSENKLYSKNVILQKTFHIHRTKHKEQKKRKLYILLTRFPDNGSKAIQALTGFYYTHASIGLEEDMNTFYSFVVKGFIVEEISRYLRPDRAPFPCQLYELEVSEKVYNSVKKILSSYIERKKHLRYTKLGLVFCLLRIPYKKDHHYFCSQFVADVLKQAKANRLKKNSALYLPKDFKNLPGIRLHFQGNLQSMLNYFEMYQALPQ